MLFPGLIDTEIPGYEIDGDQDVHGEEVDGSRSNHFIEEQLMARLGIQEVLPVRNLLGHSSRPSSHENYQGVSKGLPPAK